VTDTERWGGCKCGEGRRQQEGRCRRGWRTSKNRDRTGQTAAARKDQSLEGLHYFRYLLVIIVIIIVLNMSCIETTNLRSLLILLLCHCRACIHKRKQHIFPNIFSNYVPVLISCAGGRHNMPPLPAISRIRPYVCDRQMSDRQTSDVHHRLMPPPYEGGGIISVW